MMSHQTELHRDIRAGRPKQGLTRPVRWLVVLLTAVLGGGLLTQCAPSGPGTSAAVLPTASPNRSPFNVAAPGSVARMIEQVKPSIVGVFTQSIGQDFFFETVPTQGAGTGIVASADGNILTNAHVVEGAQQIEILLSDGRRVPARIVGADAQADLAVLKVNERNLKVASFGNSDDLRVGDPVVAVGNALGLPGGPTVTSGIVSALDRSIRAPNGALLQNLIQTDAAINPGNSGGALLDSAGNVVGINTAIAGDAQNIGFAIAITPARAIVDQLITTGKVVRPFMGVQMMTVSPALAAQENLAVNQGALIAAVVPASPAEKADLRTGDVIINIDGSKVSGPNDVTKAVAGKKPGDRVALEVARGRQNLKITLTLAQAA